MQALDDSKKEAQAHLADISFHYNHIHRLLSPNNFELIRLQPDGDCLFHAVLYLIDKSNMDEAIEGLPKIVSDHMLEYTDEYKPFMVSDNNNTSLFLGSGILMQYPWPSAIYCRSQ